MDWAGFHAFYTMKSLSSIWIFKITIIVYFCNLKVSFIYFMILCLFLNLFNFLIFLNYNCKSFSVVSYFILKTLIVHIFSSTVFFYVFFLIPCLQLFYYLYKNIVCIIYTVMFSKTVSGIKYMSYKCQLSNVRLCSGKKLHQRVRQTHFLSYST